MNDIKTKIDKTYDKLTRTAEKAKNRSDFEKALAALSLAATLQYTWNQQFYDDYLENMLEETGKSFLNSADTNWEADPDTVLFYDGFGLDTRGLALIYMKALAVTGKKIIYVTDQKVTDKQPKLKEEIKSGNIVYEYINFDKYTKRTIQLLELFKKYKPGSSFLYSTPWDVSGVLVFNTLKDRTNRYLINLTDHAFWLGKNAFDELVEFRPYGANVSVHQRKVSAKQICIIPFYPYIRSDGIFQGFPFNPSNKKIIFSGGVLYKTIDENLTYYKLVASLLNDTPNLVFLYAGGGDASHLNALAKEFPDRVYHCEERSDLFELLKHVDLYLNTYPVLGGLMTQYAAKAGKIPLTLYYDHIGDDFLINQKERQIEYRTVQDLANDTQRLLRDPSYLKEREAALDGSVPSETEFNEFVFRLLEGSLDRAQVSSEPLDLSKQFYDYRVNFTPQTLDTVVVKKRYNVLAYYFPVNWLRMVIKKILKK